MAVEVILPKVDMDMSTGTISKWHVKNGDTVKKGSLLFEMETDKSAIEIESPGDGIIHNIAAESGVPVNIGTVVAMIYGANEKLQETKSAAPIAATVVAAPVEITKSIATFVANGTGMRATPLARHLARQKNIALSTITGSGPRGRIVAADIQSHKIATPNLAPAPEANATMALYQKDNFTVIPLDGMRRTIAQRLTLSKQTVPHFYLSSSCDISQLLDIRERINALAPKDAEKKPLWKLSINDCVIKALALALQRVPAANVTYTDAGILQHRSIDIGVAVSVEGGLFTPVLRSAESKSLSQISIEMKDLAARARARKLQPPDYQGGTTAVSNLGMYGIEQFTAIINPPQATILAVGAGIEQFVPVNRQPVLRTVMSCTLSCDHRAVDGAVGAELLQAFRSFIEEPALMLA
jgi:pyruvate dehydrogenase E2 component (dihydrolipoamide acetyltransferase)